jgi:hypothetical protein
MKRVKRLLYSVPYGLEVLNQPVKVELPVIIEARPVQVREMDRVLLPVVLSAALGDGFVTLPNDSLQFLPQ